MKNAAGAIQHEWAGREGKSSLLFLFISIINFRLIFQAESFASLSNLLLAVKKRWKNPI